MDFSIKGKSLRRLVVEEGGDKAITSLVGGIASAIPERKFDYIWDYRPENFFIGNESFRSTSKRGAKWQFGYARRSLVPDDYLIKRYYIAGYLQFPPNVMSGVLDDIAVRVISVNDGSGRGTTVFAVIDCVGISNTDVRAIRSRLADFAAENGIASINISAIHCHSAIDTQGLWGELTTALVNNIKAIRKDDESSFISGRDPHYMEQLYTKTADAVREAVSEMKKGKLYYSMTDKLGHNRDKRPPDVMDRNLLSLRFVPDDGSKETVAAFMAAHPVALGPKNTLCSSDYIYYIEEEVNKAGRNFIFFQGAELAIATAGNENLKIDECPSDRGFQKYGRAIGRYLSSVPEDEWHRLAPLINTRLQEVFVPADSPILALAGKLGIVSNRVLKTGKGRKDFCFVTEMGYVELGKELAFALIPGELAGEIQFGGGKDENTSYNGTAWEYPPLNDMVPGDRHLTVIGLCNDSVGYIIPDNDFGSMLAKLHYEESVSAGRRTGSTMANAFRKLTDKCKAITE